MTIADLEKRVAALESQLAAIHSEPNAVSHPLQMLESIHNTIPNDEASREAMRLGRKWRESQRPKARANTRKSRK